MKIFCSDWPYLIRNHLSFLFFFFFFFCCFFVGFFVFCSQIFTLKIKFTAKSWSDLCNFYSFPKRGNRNTKRTEKHKNKMTHGKTYNKSPRKINHKATKSKTNTGATSLERSVEQTTGGFKALLQLANFTLGPDATLNTETHKNSVRIKAPNSVNASKRKHKNQINHYNKQRRVLTANSTVCQSKWKPIVEPRPIVKV